MTIPTVSFSEGHLDIRRQRRINQAHFVHKQWAAGTFGFHPISPLSVPIQPEISYPPPVPVEPLSEVIRRLELVSAQMHNLRLAARNARNPDGKLELLEKTIEDDGADLANAVKGPNMSVSIPLGHAKLRDRPGKFFTFTGYLCDFTDQGILDLIVFYNNDFGIVEEDGLDVRKEKLLSFLTR